MKEALKLALEALEDTCFNSAARVRTASKIIKEALAQPEQEPNKDGSPCPEFWDWLPKAYNFEGDGNFTKYNMEVAFLAGKQAAQPEQEPVVWRDHVEQRLLTWRQSFVNKSGDQLTLDDFMDKRSLDDLIDFVCDKYTTPPQRTWVGLTPEEVEACIHHVDEDGIGLFDFAEAIEAKLKEKNT